MQVNPGTGAKPAEGNTYGCAHSQATFDLGFAGAVRFNSVGVKTGQGADADAPFSVKSICNGGNRECPPYQPVSPLYPAYCPLTASRTWKELRRRSLVEPTVVARGRAGSSLRCCCAVSPFRISDWAAHCHIPPRAAAAAYGLAEHNMDSCTSTYGGRVYGRAVDSEVCAALPRWHRLVAWLVAVGCDGIIRSCC